MQTYWFYFGARLLGCETAKNEQEARMKMRENATLHKSPYEAPFEFIQYLNLSVVKVY